MIYSQNDKMRKILWENPACKKCRFTYHNLLIILKI